MLLRLKVIIFRDRHLDICHLDIWEFSNSHILLWSQTKTFTVHALHLLIPLLSCSSRGFSFPSFCLKYLASLSFRSFLLTLTFHVSVRCASVNSYWYSSGWGALFQPFIVSIFSLFFPYPSHMVIAWHVSLSTLGVKNVTASVEMLGLALYWVDNASHQFLFSRHSTRTSWVTAEWKKTRDKPKDGIWNGTFRNMKQHLN